MQTSTLDNRALGKWNVNDPDRWDAYCKTYYGLGRPDAKWWILGIEPGVHISERENISAALELRGLKWGELEGKPFVDLAEYHERLGLTRWKTKLQPTWRRPLLVRDVALGGQLDAQQKNRILEAQWSNPDIAYVDFWPFPNHTVGDWYGSKVQHAPSYLKTRPLYEEELRDMRREWMARELAARLPDTVTIAAGAAIRPELEAVIEPRYWNACLERRTIGPDRHCLIRMQNGGLLLTMSQGWGITNKHLEALGLLVRKHLRG